MTEQPETPVPATTESPESESVSWQEVCRVMAEVMRCEETERASYLNIACAGRPALLEEVRSLLAGEIEAEGWLADPLVPRRDLTPVIGTTIGPYRLIDKIGSGGMGEVYLAERIDAEWEQRVAIKRLRGLLARESILRFRTERQILANLDHPNIARLLDGGTVDGEPYLVMDYVEGTSVDVWCRQDEPTLGERLEVFLEICSAVEHAHRHLVVHRDLKPANVLVTPEGRTKLLDFGIAKLLSEEPTMALTVEGCPATPGYASPEQLAGGSITTSSDVYSLGVVLFEMLSGQRLGEFSRSTSDLPTGDRSPSSSRLSTAARRSQSAVSRAWHRRLKGDLDTIVARALELDPADRYASAADLAGDIRRYRQGLPIEGRRSWSYRIRKLVQRQWKGLAAMLLTALMVSGWAVSHIDKRHLEAENRGRTQLANAVTDYLIEVFDFSDSSRSGERNEALVEILERGVTQLDEHPGIDQSPIIKSALLGTLGGVLRRQGETARAEELLAECLRLRREHLPAGDPLISLAEINLANVLRQEGDLDGARGLLTSAIASIRSTKTEAHETFAAALGNLAGVERTLGAFDASEQLYREALSIKLAAPELFDEVSIATTRHGLATTLYDRGELDRAEALWREILAQVGDDRGTAPLAARIEFWLGKLLAKRGEFDAACEVLKSSLETLERLYPAGHSWIIDGGDELARLQRGAC